MTSSSTGTSYLFVQNGVGAAFVNALLNGAIAWAITRGLLQFPVWSVPGVVADIVVTAFGIAFGTCIFASVQVRWDLSRGRITPGLGQRFRSWVARFPPGTLRRGLWLGAVSVAAFCPLVVLALAVFARGSLDRGSFIALKAIFSGIEGAIVTPFIVVAAIADRSRAAGAAHV